MTRRNKTISKFFNIVAMFVGIIAALAIGGAFVSGLFLDVVILKYLPLIVHQVVGWTIIVSTLVSFVLGILK